MIVEEGRGWRGRGGEKLNNFLLFKKIGLEDVKELKSGQTNED